MLRRVLIAGLLLLPATRVLAAEGLTSSAVVERDTEPGNGWRSDGEPNGRVVIGDPAPAFSYLGADGAWHEFRQLMAQGPVLLVFGARDAQLADLDRALPALAGIGVWPVAAFDMRVGSVARLTRRLHLKCGVIADPQCVIGGLYSSIDPVTQRNSISWFVIDAEGRIRAGGRGELPGARELVKLAARGLGRAEPDATIPM